MRLDRALATIGLLLALASSAIAQSGCGGQAGAGKFCGNPAGATGLPSFVTIPAGSLTPIAGRTVLGNPTNALAAPVATGLAVGNLGIVGSAARNGLLYHDSSDLLGNLATANNGVLKTDGSGVPSVSSTLPSGLSIPNLTITGSFTATGLVTNADLTNASITVNGATCTLGGSCSPAIVLVVGTSAISGGALNGILYNNSNVLGNLATANNGVLVTGVSGVPSISSVLPTLTGQVNVSYTSATLGMNDSSGGGFARVDFQNTGATKYQIGNQVLSANNAFVLFDTAFSRYALKLNQTSGLMELQPTGGVVAVGGPAGTATGYTLGVAGLSTFLATTTSSSPGIYTTGITSNFFSGGAASGPLDNLNPTVFIGRVEQNNTGGGGANEGAAGLTVVVTGSQNVGSANANQTNGITTFATKTAAATGNVVGTNTTTILQGTHGTAFGAFIQALHTNVGSTDNNGIGIELGVQDGSGVSKSYNPTVGSGHANVGLEISYAGSVSGSTPANGGAALEIHASSGKWGVGIGFMVPDTINGGIDVADIQSDTSATNLWLANSGAHVSGLDWRGATFSTAIINANGFVVASTGNTSVGKAGLSTGTFGLVGITSGAITQTVQAAAGSATVTWGTSSGTPVVTASSPLAITAATGNITCTGCLTNTPAALTKTDDTNVTLTLGGTPSTALLQATSLTLGWTGTLSASRGGTGIASLGTGVPTAFGINVGTAGSFVVNGGALGTPSSGTLTNASGLPTTGLTGTLQAAQEPAHTGDVTNTAGSLALTLATAQSAVHTWALAQTFTVAPVFTDQSGTRTALGLGTMATQNANAVAITGGTIVGLTGLAIRDTSAAFDVTIAGTSSATLTAGRTLTLDVGNVAHTLKFGTTANTITFPNVASDTVALLGAAQTLSGVNTFSNATNATALGTGAVIISNGGLSVAGNLYAGALVAATGASPSISLFDTGTGTSSFNFYASSVTQQYQFGNQTGAFFMYDVVNARYFVRMNATANTLELASGGTIALSLGTTGTVTTNNGTTDATSVSTGSLINKGGFATNKRVWMNGLSASSAGLSAACVENTGEITQNTGVTTCLISAREWKKNIRPLPDLTANLVALQPRLFDWRDPRNGTDEQIGFIADEVAAVDNRLAVKSKDGKWASWRQEEMIAMLVQGYQRGKAANDNFEARLEKLENRK